MARTGPIFRAILEIRRRGRTRDLEAEFGRFEQMIEPQLDRDRHDLGTPAADRVWKPIVVLIDQLIVKSAGGSESSGEQDARWFSHLERRLFGTNKGGEFFPKEISRLIESAGEQEGLVYIHAMSVGLGYEVTGVSEALRDGLNTKLRAVLEARVGPEAARREPAPNNPPRLWRRLLARPAMMIAICSLLFALGWNHALRVRVADRADHVAEELGTLVAGEADV